LVRPWWKANAPFFQAKNYKAVQPGSPPPRDPFETNRRATASEPGTSAVSSANRMPPARVPGPHVGQSASPPVTWLMIGAFAAIAVVAGILYASKRRF
jgi:hypothetical protein